MNDYITAQVAEILESAGDKGFVLPWHMAIIGANGAMFYSRYVANAEGTGLDCEVLREYTPDDGFKTPINIVVVDSEGNAQRAVLEGPSQRLSRN